MRGSVMPSDVEEFSDMFIGQTRFSLFDPSSGDWRASNGSRFFTVDEYRRYLLSPDRLTPRCDIFLNLSLPQLSLAAKDFDVHHIVSYSKVLPEPYKAQLRNAADEYPFVVLDERDEDGAGRPSDAVAKLYEGSRAPFARYRLDDDDVLPVDYFSQMAPYVRAENVGMNVSLGSGVTALYSEGRFYNLRECYSPLSSMGLLSICRYAADGTLARPMDAPHNLSDRANPVILDSRRTGYFWTRHVTQDTVLTWEPRHPQETVEVLLRYLDKYPPVGAEADVEAAFPVLVSRFSQARTPGASRTWRYRDQIELTPRGHGLPVDCARGPVTVSVDVLSTAAAGDNSALLCFRMTGPDGRMLTAPDDAALLAGCGVVASEIADVGFYAYLPVPAGRSRFTRTFRLPEGVTLTALSLRQFRRNDVRIVLDGVLVEEVA
jgi:hypothetical protein